MAHEEDDAIAHETFEEVCADFVVSRTVARSDCFSHVVEERRGPELAVFGVLARFVEHLERVEEGVALRMVADRLGHAIEGDEELEKLVERSVHLPMGAATPTGALDAPEVLPEGMPMSITVKGFFGATRSAFLVGAAIVATSGVSFAGSQSVDSSSRDALDRMRVTKPAPAGAVDPADHAAFERLRVNDVARRVRAVRLDPHGAPTGVILSDGTQYVGTPSRYLTTVAKPGDPVRVELGTGDRLVVVDTKTMLGATLGPRGAVDLQPLVEYPSRPSAPSAIGGGPRDAAVSSAGAPRLDDATELGRYAINGRVDLVLTTPNGAPTGLLLSDGTQVHVLPRVADVLSRIHAGDEVRVEGRGTKTAEGTSMWALGIMQDRRVILDLERGAGAPELGIVGNGPQ